MVDAAHPLAAGVGAEAFQYYRSANRIMVRQRGCPHAMRIVHAHIKTHTRAQAHTAVGCRLLAVRCERQR